MGNCRTGGRPSGACPLWAGQLSTERCSGPFSFRIVLLYFVLIRYHTAIQYDTQAVFVTLFLPFAVLAGVARVPTGGWTGGLMGDMGLAKSPMGLDGGAQSKPP